MKKEIVTRELCASISTEQLLRHIYSLPKPFSFGGVKNPHASSFLRELTQRETAAEISAQVAESLARSRFGKVCLPESVDHLDLDMAKRCLDELRREFDCVLINAPPLNRSAYGIAFGELADDLVPALEAGTARGAVARQVPRNSGTAHVRVVGAVLHQSPSGNPEIAWG